jgi:hypothetical protein
VSWRPCRFGGCSPCRCFVVVIACRCQLTSDSSSAHAPADLLLTRHRKSTHIITTRGGFALERIDSRKHVGATRLPCSQQQLPSTLCTQCCPADPDARSVSHAPFKCAACAGVCGTERRVQVVCARMTSQVGVCGGRRAHRGAATCPRRCLLVASCCVALLATLTRIATLHLCHSLCVVHAAI